MKHFQKHKGQEFVPYLLLILFTVLFCYVFCVKYGIFGSKVDWISQHSVLPDYFRKQFYQTGQLIPEFAANIGGGQNIYNFAYYGLFSPLFLPSYLLPFVKMSDYVMGMSFICLIASVLLLYHWLRKKEFSGKISFCISLAFLLAGPVIYHSYSQIMFVNYMPFLILGLLNVDRYFESISCENIHDQISLRKQAPLILSLYLMIMTSFYFSICGMLVLVIYGIYRYGQLLEAVHQKVQIRYFFLDGIHFLTSFIIAICLSGVLLVPTACALSGRSDSSGTAEGIHSIAELLIPQIKLTGLFYSSYGLGCGTFLFTVLVASLFYKKWSDRFLAYSVLIILTVPLFLYLLNGGLYLRYKALIPFLPLLCYMMACYLQRQERFIKIPLIEYLPYILTIILIYYAHTQGQMKHLWKYLLFDAVITLGAYCLFCFRKNSLFLVLPMLVFLTLFNSVSAMTYGKMEDVSSYKKITASETEQMISETLDQENGYYRMVQLGTADENTANLNRIWDIRQNISSIYSSSYNTLYQEFRQNTFDVEQPYRNSLMQSVSYNPVYQRFMGEKYIVSDQPLTGYTLYKDYGNYKVYENPLAAPIVYGTSKTLAEDAYKKLQFPYNQTALLSYAVTKDTSDPSTVNAATFEDESKIRKVSFTLPEDSSWLYKCGDGYKVEGKTNHSIKLFFDTDPMNADTKDTASDQKVLFLRFQVTNLHPGKDMTIWVDGERNKLSAGNHIYYNENTTFTYALPVTEGQNSVEMTFGKGSYEISQIEAYTGVLPDDALYQSTFQVDHSESKGNKIAGTITMNDDGYLITSVPYEDSFEIQVDGKLVSSEKVNTAFLGCRLQKGTHSIRIVYHAPGVKAGKCLSVFGVLLLVLLMIKSDGILMKRRKNGMLESENQEKEMIMN